MKWVCTNAQSVSFDLESFAEELFSIQDEDLDYEDLYESLSSYYIDPLNLNKASREELESLYILTPKQINSLMDHRKNYGDLLSVYELQAVEKFDPGTIEDLLPFIRIRESSQDARPFLKRLVSEKNNYLLIRYSPGKSNPSNKDHLGDPSQLYTRLRVNHKNDFSLGMTMEKDPGETIWNDSIRGFDFYSFHFQLEKRGILDNLIIGDYQIQTGQGLVFGAGFAPGKGASISTIRRSNVGIRPYTSARESGFFRGLSSTLNKKSFKITGFVSVNHQDAGMHSDSSENSYREFIRSIRESGLHRTVNEYSAKDNVREISYGGVVLYEVSRSLNIGVNYLGSQFSQQIIPEERKYNQYEFRGTKNQITSVFFNSYYQNMVVFGELARSLSGGIGAVAGISAVIHPTIQTSILYRNYDPDFHSFYGNGFGENSRSINEKGIYWGISFTPDRHHQLTIYYDIFTFPWLKFRVDAPSSGNEFLMRYTYSPTREIDLFLQVRNETKDRNLSNNEETLPIVLQGKKTNITANGKFILNNWLTMKTRVQYSMFHHGTHTKGIAIAHDIKLDFKKLRITGRMAVFDTDDFDNRQYMFENDVLYAFSVPAYYGKGIRSYLLLNYKWNDHLKFWIKYSRYFYQFKPSIERSVNSDHVRIQLQLSL